MKSCKDYRDLMAEALLGEIAREDRASLESHVAGCADCAAEYQALRLTLELVDVRERSDPGEEFWEGYWDRLMIRREKEARAENQRLGWRNRLASLGRSLPRWAYQAAAVVILVGAGILIGRLIFFPPGPREKLAVAPPATSVIAASSAGPAARARDYLDRSKLVILALVNYNPATEDVYALDLPLQKRISRELVDEAGRLKSDLKDPRDRRLRELVSDLETILIQIANLAPGNDLEAVDFVRQGVAARGVLLKINLSEMDGRPPAKKNANTHGRPRTEKSSA